MTIHSQDNSKTQQLVISIKSIFQDLDYVFENVERAERSIRLIEAMFKILENYKPLLPRKFLKAFDKHVNKYKLSYNQLIKSPKMNLFLKRREEARNNSMQSGFFDDYEYRPRHERKSNDPFLPKKLKGI